MNDLIWVGNTLLPRGLVYGAIIGLAIVAALALAALVSKAGDKST